MFRTKQILVLLVPVLKLGRATINYMKNIDGHFLKDQCFWKYFQIDKNSLVLG